MFPATRLRRLRQSEPIRTLFGTPLPGPEKFIWPTFVVEGENRREPIESMPGQARLGISQLLRDLDSVAASGIGGILLFGMAEPRQKDASGSAAHDEKGAVQTAIRAVKRHFPQLVVMTDACVCAYTNHGHCGVLSPAGQIENDTTNAILAQIALSHAAAGADVVAPSAMMDGQVQAIRTALDSNGFDQTLMMSYSTKFASSLYGPFREAEQSAPSHGDRQGYQASYRDLRTALRESELDEAEGADLLMVKPALFYLDVLVRLREQSRLPIAAYNVSGEYAMLHATAARGWGDLRAMARESTAAIARAGADLQISYWANQYDALFQD